MGIPKDIITINLHLIIIHSFDKTVFLQI